MPSLTCGGRTPFRASSWFRSLRKRGWRGCGATPVATEFETDPLPCCLVPHIDLTSDSPPGANLSLSWPDPGPIPVLFQPCPDPPLDAVFEKSGRDARAPGSPKAMLQSDNAGCYSRLVMKASQKLVLAGLVTIAAAAIVGLILTGSPPGPETPSKGQRTPLADQGPVVDEKILDAAQKLAALAATREEQQQARDAVRLADHEVDLAFTG